MRRYERWRSWVFVVRAPQITTTISPWYNLTKHLNHDYMMMMMMKMDHDKNNNGLLRSSWLLWLGRCVCIRYRFLGFICGLALTYYLKGPSFSFFKRIFIVLYFVCLFSKFYFLMHLKILKKKILLDRFILLLFLKVERKKKQPLKSSPPLIPSITLNLNN